MRLFTRFFVAFFVIAYFGFATAGLINHLLFLEVITSQALDFPGDLPRNTYIVVNHNKCYYLLAFKINNHKLN